MTMLYPNLYSNEPEVCDKETALYSNTLTNAMSDWII